MWRVPISVGLWIRRGPIWIGLVQLGLVGVHSKWTQGLGCENEWAQGQFSLFSNILVDFPKMPLAALTCWMGSFDFSSLGRFSKNALGTQEFLLGTKGQFRNFLFFLLSRLLLPLFFPILSFSSCFCSLSFWFFFLLFFPVQQPILSFQLSILLFFFLHFPLFFFSSISFLLILLFSIFLLAEVYVGERGAAGGSGGARGEQRRAVVRRRWVRGGEMWPEA